VIGQRVILFLEGKSTLKTASLDRKKTGTTEVERKTFLSKIKTSKAYRMVISCTSQNSHSQNLSSRSFLLALIG
jgi:hypothetical protein